MCIRDRFTIGILGFVLNRKNILLMMISIEILLLAVTILVLASSMNFDDILGQTYGIYIILLAAAESAIGLGILVAYYRLRGSISLANDQNSNTTVLSLSIVVWNFHIEINQCFFFYFHFLV